MNEFPRTYLVREAKHLATVIADGATRRLEQYSQRDVVDAFDSVRGMSDGKRCNYALKAIGPVYSLLFHGRRLHDALCHVHSACKALSPKSTAGVLDYGTGTGAVTWALAILHCGGSLPFASRPLVVDAYDLSRNMLQEAQDIWNELIRRKEFSDLATHVMIRWHGGTPSEVRVPGDCTTRHACAGYALSDESVVAAEVDALLKFTENCSCETLALWSSPGKLGDEQKRKVLTLAAHRGWMERPVLEEHRSANHGFWHSAVDDNACGRALQEHVEGWPESILKALFRQRMHAKTMKLWLCGNPTSPLICLARGISAI